jgi:hypothetical protein
MLSYCPSSVNSWYMQRIRRLEITVILADQVVLQKLWYEEAFLITGHESVVSASFDSVRDLQL